MTAPDPVTASEAVAAATGNPPAPRRAVLGGATSRIAWSVLGLLVLLALCAPLIAPYPPGEQDLMNTFAPPSGEHWLGTDNLGRDQFSRLLYGLRASLAIALMTTAAVALFGIPLGAVAGYARGFLNTAIARFIDMGLALPRSSSRWRSSPRSARGRRARSSRSPPGTRRTSPGSSAAW